MKARHKRLSFVVLGLVGIGVSAVLIFNVFQQNMVFFHSPSDVFANKAPKNTDFRLGGLVEQGSLKREDDGLTVHFLVTDRAQTIPVTYTGILPDLFKEGTGVVAQGKMDGGTFLAKEVLAKHDENYMSPEVAQALEKAKIQTAATLSSTQ